MRSEGYEGRPGVGWPSSFSKNKFGSGIRHGIHKYHGVFTLKEKLRMPLIIYTCDRRQIDGAEDKAVITLAMRPVNRQDPF